MVCVRVCDQECAHWSSRSTQDAVTDDRLKYGERILFRELFVVRVCPYWLAAGPIILLWFSGHQARCLVSDGYALASCEDCSVGRWNQLDVSTPSACHPLQSCIFHGLLLLREQYLFTGQDVYGLNLPFFEMTDQHTFFLCCQTDPVNILQT